MTFFRHFIERDDFETLVVSNSQFLDEYELPYQPVRFAAPAWWQRVARTRLLPWVHGAECLWGDRLLPPSILTTARQFAPDAVFTVAGSWHWTALAAQRVARELDIPLIASFNDWFSYGWFPAHPRFYAPVEARFRRFYREADLALCTSEGMREALGEHPNAHVLYPTGAPMTAEAEDYRPDGVGDRPFTILFAGSLADWYGPMLEAVIRECQQRFPRLRFRIFGSRPTWSAAFDEWAIAQQIFCGHLPFEQLRQEARAADLLLLPMGFDPACAQVERTSFKTKFLDYLAFRRPILVWGPAYCSAIRTAQEFDSAECVTDADPLACATALDALAHNARRRAQLIANAQTMYADRFHPDGIHAGLVQKVRETLDQYPHQPNRMPG